MPVLSNDQYHIGWICALTEEVAASRAVLDEVHGRIVVTAKHDQNSYTAGSIHNHNIVIARLPAGKHGVAEAAAVAKDMVRTFPNLNFGLMVGIGGGLPDPHNADTVRLGDVVVSQPEGTHGGVIQFDLGKRLIDGMFTRKGTMAAPPSALLIALGDLQAEHELNDSKVPEYIAAALQNYPKLATSGYSFPGAHRDLLFRSDSPHTLGNYDCAKCDRTKIVPRSRLDDRPAVHFGTILSSSQVIKDAVERDRLRDEYGALCVEMEAAGLMNIIPSLVIRGICDYADSHKNDIWHKYASIAAAAFVKELLFFVSPAEATSQPLLEQTPNIDLLQPMTDLRNAITSSYEAIKVTASEQDRERIEKEKEKIENELRQCHQALITSSSYVESKNIIPLRAPDTCKWVLEDEKFKSWLNNTQNDLLWISADPGCGKSVLSRTLIDEILVEEAATVCYFFFRDRTSQNTLALALCAILHQLFSQQPELRKKAKKAYAEYGSAVQQETERLWQIFMEAATDSAAGPIICVVDALDEASAASRHLLVRYLCEFYLKSNKVKDTQTDMKEKRSKLKIIVTSRPYDTVQESFEQLSEELPKIRLRGEDKNNLIGEEIDIVIKHRVQDIAYKFGLAYETQSRLQQRLLDMRNRTYLWLHLALDDIYKTYKHSSDPDSVEIRSLPVSVDEAYEKILDRIDQAVRILVKRILLVIVGARRALSVEEIGLATLLLDDTRPTSLKGFKVNRSHMTSHMREWCGLFIFFNDGKVYLIHQTAKEFLMRDTASGGGSESSTEFWRGSLNPVVVEKTMAQICMDYMTLDDFRNPDSGIWTDAANWICASVPSAQKTSKWFSLRLKIDSDKAGKGDQHDLAFNWDSAMQFLEYSSKYWYSHVNDAALPDTDLMWMSIAEIYAEQYDGFDLWPFYIWDIVSARTKEAGLDIFYHWATIRGIYLLVVTDHFHILALPCVIDDGDDEDDLKLGLVDGFLLDQQMRTGETPLIFASMLKFTGSVKWLLDRGADISIQAPVEKTFWKDEYYMLENVPYPEPTIANNKLHHRRWDALDYALWYNHVDAVKMLLEAGADPKLRGSYHSAINRALQFDHLRCANLLLEHGCQLDLMDWETAARFGRYEFINSQVDRCVVELWDKKLNLDVFVKIIDGRSQDQAAVHLQWLQCHHWDRNLDLRIWKFIVHEASDECLHSLRKWQIKQGFDSDIINGVLQDAIFAERTSVVKNLLKFGASPNPEPTECGTHLQALFRTWLPSHRLEILDALLEAGVDPNIPDRWNRRPLSLAVSSQESGVVQRLLVAGAVLEDDDLVELEDEPFLELVAAKAIVDMDVQDHLDERLGRACERMDRKRAIMLLDLGANLNRINHKGRTMLVGAVQAGRSDIVRFLVDQDVKADFQGALEAVVEVQASGSTHFDYEATSWICAELLLEAGANATEARDRLWMTLCQVLHLRPRWRSNHRIQKVFANLLRIGADPNVDIESLTTNSEHVRPLHIACFKDDLPNVDLLLEYKADVNLDTTDCPYPLEIACARNHTEIAAKLIQAGANIQEGSMIMPLPLQSACMSQNTALAEMLLASGANPMASDGYEGPPIQIAQHLGNGDLLTLLESYASNFVL